MSASSSIDRSPSGKWRARYYDGAGKRHSRSFDRHADARAWLTEQRSSLQRGVHVDPRAGAQTFREYAEQWRAAQVHRLSSASHVETTLRRHAYPVLGDLPLAAVRPSAIQVWVRGLSDVLAPSTVGVAHSIVASVFRAAVRDRLIIGSPCEGTRLPRVEPRRVQPLPTETVEALAEHAPDRLTALVVLAAGTGLRFGEAVGLTVDRVDFLRATLLVDRQLATVDGLTPFLAPPKTSASHRLIPLPRVVVEVLAEHLSKFPAEVRQVPLGRPDGPLVPGEFLFLSPRMTPIRRTSFGTVWRRTVALAGAPDRTGFHQLRHFYASLLIRHGESVKVVQARLGHASAGETLDTYSHLWPDSDDRTREAVDAVLGSLGSPVGHSDAATI